LSDFSDKIMRQLSTHDPEKWAPIFGQDHAQTKYLLMSTEVAARATAEDVARRSYGKLVAFLSARTRDVAAAEDAWLDLEERRP